VITRYTRRFLSPLYGLLVGLILVVATPFPVSAAPPLFAPPPAATIRAMIGLLNNGTCAQVYDATAPLTHRSLTRVATVRACNQGRSAMRGTGLIIRYTAMGRGVWASVAVPDYRGRAYDQPVAARVWSCGRSQRYLCTLTSQRKPIRRACGVAGGASATNGPCNSCLLPAVGICMAWGKRGRTAR